MQYAARQSTVSRAQGFAPSLPATRRPVPDLGIWTRKELDRDSYAIPPAADKGYPKPLGAMMRGANLSKLEKSEAPYKNHLSHQLKHHKLDHLKVGKELGRGGMKTAYDLPGTGRALVTIPPGGWSLDTEIVNLERLRKAGVPAAKILDVGNYKGSPAMVMKKYEDVVKPVPPDTPLGKEFIASKLTNHKTLDSLIKIRDAIARENIIIFDLQYGISADGALEVVDPLSVLPVGDGLTNENGLKTLDQLISAMKKKLHPANHAA